MNTLYRKIRPKFNLKKFNKLLSEEETSEIFHIVEKMTGFDPICDHRIDFGQIDLDFLNILCDFKKTLEYTPLISLVTSSEPSVYGETEFGLLKLKLDGDKKFKFYLTKFIRYDFSDRPGVNEFFSYNFYKENENINYQNCVDNIYKKIDRKVYVNIVVFHEKNNVTWSKDKLKTILRDPKLQQFISEADKDIEFNF